MENLTRALEGLHVEGAQLETLKGALTTEGICKEEAGQKILGGGVLQKLRQLLADKNVNQSLVAEVIAEIAKIESCRVPCVKADVIGLLLDMMEAEDLAKITQACRALGNICFDNDEGRERTVTAGGVERLLSVMRKLLGKTRSDTVSTARTVSCGCLLNLCNTHVNVQQKAVSAGALDVLHDYLRQCPDDETLCQYALLCVGCLADSEAGVQKLEETNMVVTIATLLNQETDYQETIFELLSSLCEQDSIKTKLCERSVIDAILHIVNTSSDEDTIKMAADLIVLLLTGDESMELLYDSAQGVVYKESLKWLTSSRSHLRMTGALAIGNFARSDSQCLSLVESGATQELIALLQQEQADPTLLHAAFSALRNLAIPEKNKKVMLESGLLDAVLPHITVDFAAVQFKLLGTLRMVLAKQESACIHLGTNAGFMARLAEWCAEEEHAGVKGEATRLAANLVKTSRAPPVMKQVVSSGCIKHVVGMVTSEHAIMQNEALLAVALIVQHAPGELDASFQQQELIPAVKVALTDSDSATEVLLNCLTLTHGLAKSDDTKALLKLAGFPQIVKDLSKHPNSNLQTSVKAVSAVLANG